VQFSSSEGEHRYADLVRVADRTIVGLDFDGTLSPIVDDPGRARIHPEAAEVLIELAPQVAAAEGWKVRGNPRRKLTITTANGRTLTLAPLSKPAAQPRNRAPRARSPRRRRIRSSSAASRDGPESDSDPLSPRPARAGLEAVLFPRRLPRTLPRTRADRGRVGVRKEGA
jgi:hypothetical protein